MTGTVAQLWRHPIKSHGREALEAITLTAGQTIPWDRHWAVTHETTQFDWSAPQWVSCQNFMLGTRTPGLAGIWAELDESAATVTLTHTELGDIRFAPDDADGVAQFLAWIAPLCPETRSRPTGIVHVPGRGMTDSAYPSVSIMNLASHQAVADRLAQPITAERWRGNIWLQGVPAWDEFGWIDRYLQIGDAVLAIREPIKRCLHTAANPITGLRDADTLGALESGWSHRNFGVYAEVVTGGAIRIGDQVEAA
jgi:uncharacterized protein YcbX